MNNSYKCIFPYDKELGTIQPIIVNNAPMETKEEQALWYYNRMRDHDNLPHVDKLPKGVKFLELY